MSYLLKCVNELPYPIYLKLAFDEASRWTSHEPDQTMRLEVTIRASILKLFALLEFRHGSVFVAHALGYLTIGKSM